jgi:hypothetical protein
MSSHSIIDLKTYDWMLKRINLDSFYSDVLAGEDELNFIKDDSWFSETVVISQIVLRKGQWHVDLLFAYQKEPYKFLIRNITSCISQTKASITGEIMKRQASKDQRGTLTIKEDQFDINLN